LPRLRPRLLGVPVVALTFLLAACGSSGGGATTSASSTSPAPVVTAPGPVPEVSGDFGAKPKVTMPTATPADALVTKTLVTGTGDEVKSGDLLVADYVGLTWDDGKEFDSSFKRGTPASFPIGVGQVIQGWDAGLVGQTVGSRVVLAIPPSLGYGEAGQSSAGIEGDDTLVFVVDILGTYPADAVSDATATAVDADLTGLPQVSGLPGEQPAVTVPSGTAAPAKVKAVLLAKGDGVKVTAGSLLIVNYEAVSWAGETLGSTWSQHRPQGVAVGLAATPSPFDQAVGMTVGSRFMLLVPPQEGGDASTDTAVAVVDIVDSIPSTR
jgi:peptidylprolyl isomerase